jgi:hypothetical protein
MRLFLDQLPELETLFIKEAAFTARVSEEPGNWPQEVTSDLLKQLPYLSDYEVNVTLDRVEPQRGFAFGYADVGNRTERPEQEHADAGLPHIRIPIIIIEKAVKPFSVFLDGQKVLPLNEDRIRKALFNPQTFDLSSVPPKNPSLVEQTMPPVRSGIGMGGETKMASVQEGSVAPVRPKFGLSTMLQGPAGVAKSTTQQLNAQKTASILKEIASTIRESDANSFVEKVASDHTLRAGFSRSGIASTLVEVFDKTKRASADERLHSLAERIEPTVVTLQKLPGGDFLVKSANVNAFAGDQQAAGQVVPQQEVGQAIGQDQAQSMVPGQVATAVSDPVAQKEEKPNKAKIVEEFGEYKVQDAVGNTLMGWIFPTCLAWGDFTEQPIALFTNGSAYAVQDTVAGELVGKGTNLPDSTPRGDGVFYKVEGGDAICTSPISIGSSAAGPDGLPKFVGTDVFGNQLVVSQAEGLRNPERISETEYALPQDWKFMRLNNQTQLVPDPSQMNKTAAARSLAFEATLFYNGAYQLTGGCGLEKVASSFRHDLDAVSAEFMLGLLGVDGVTAKMKVAEARKKGSVKLAGLKTITTLGERYKESEKTASAILKQIPNLRKDLIKEAAVLQDEGTVDHILALNFINPENLQIFLSYIPELEATSEKLAEMLMYSYLGMNQLPEGALERSMRNLEEVIQALQAVAQAEI